MQGRPGPEVELYKNLFAKVGPEFDLLGLGPPALSLKIEAKPSYGVVRLPPPASKIGCLLIYFAGLAVSSGVVRGRVVANPVGHGLNKDGLGLADCVVALMLAKMYRCLRGLVDGKDVVAIYSDCPHAIGHTPTSDGVSSVLLPGWGTNCILVVSTAVRGSNYQKKIAGAPSVTAKLRAAWKSPSLAAPSPK